MKKLRDSIINKIEIMEKKGYEVEVVDESSQRMKHFLGLVMGCNKSKILNLVNTRKEKEIYLLKNGEYKVEVLTKALLQEDMSKYDIIIVHGSNVLSFKRFDELLDKISSASCHLVIVGDSKMCRVIKDDVFTYLNNRHVESLLGNTLVETAKPTATTVVIDEAQYMNEEIVKSIKSIHRSSNGMFIEIP